MNRLLGVAFLLAFVGGYADAASFLLTRSFTGHLTGNTVFMMIHLAGAEWRAALSNGVAVVAFAAGVVAAELLEADTGAPGRARTLRWPLLIESGLLLAAAGCRWRGGPVANDLTVALLCVGMGIQNGALRKCGAMSVHTTFITGMSTSLLTGMVKRATGQGGPAQVEKNPPGTLLGVLGVFALGAGVGAGLNLRFGLWGFAGIFVPVAGALGLAWGERRESGS